jgi:hypothetical protein
MQQPANLTPRETQVYAEIYFETPGARFQRLSVCSEGGDTHYGLSFRPYIETRCRTESLKKCSKMSQPHFGLVARENQPPDSFMPWTEVTAQPIDSSVDSLHETPDKSELAVKQTYEIPQSEHGTAA